MGILKYCLLAVCFTALSLSAATTYTITPLIPQGESQGNFVSAFGSDFSPKIFNTPYIPGFASGTAAIGQLSGGSFSYTLLPPLPGEAGSYIYGTLKDGSAWGVSFTVVPTSNPFQPFAESYTPVRWQDGVPTALTFGSILNSTVAFAQTRSNPNGDLVGVYFDNGQSKLFRYNVYSNEFSNLDTSSISAFNLTPLNINESGQVIMDAGGTLGVYDLATGSWTPLPLLPGKFWTGTAQINSQGSVALTYSDFTGQQEVYEFKNGALTRVSPEANPSGFTASTVLAYNSKGIIAGNTNNALGLFDNGTFTPLFPSITNPDGWDFLNYSTGYLSGANDAGQIFGVGTFNGQRTAFVLNPNSEVPEPSTLLVISTALAVGLRYSKRK